MPKPLTLPTAATVFTAIKRPPWHLISTQEVAGLLQVNPTVFNTWGLRGQGPEPAPRELLRVPGNRTYYAGATVLRWLDARSGGTTPPGSWCRAWLASRYRGLTIEAFERSPVFLKIHPHRWPIRRDRYLAWLQSIISHDDVLPNQNDLPGSICDTIPSPVVIPR